jgi:hypothetical protein
MDDIAITFDNPESEGDRTTFVYYDAGMLVEVMGRSGTDSRMQILTKAQAIRLRDWLDRNIGGDE